MTWHLFCGQEGDCRDGLWVLTWGWTQHCHHQTSVDVPCHGCRLPSTCQLLTWHSCVVQMVYKRVQVVGGGGGVATMGPKKINKLFL